MKMHSKPIVALASGALMILGAVCQTAQAQSIIIPSTTVKLPSQDGIPADALSVTYEVTQDTANDSLFNYDYTVVDPSASTANNFTVEFDATPADAFNITGGIIGVDTGANGVYWDVTIAAGGGTSGLLSYQSPLPPVFNTANASGNASPAASWASVTTLNPFGPLVPVPGIPEPATLPMIGLAAMLLVAVKPNLLNKA